MEADSPKDSTLSVNKFVAARAQEIIALSLQIGASSSVTNKGLAFQHVPKHMRRRAVSHNIKRLPKRLHGVHSSQLAKSSGGPQKKPKRPSRKHRRRKSNLLLEYNRRQRKVKWLETHIWHAKRFHLETKWNFRLPIAPCDKGYRAIYRAFRSHCAMRDVSFYSFLEICGPVSVLSEKFRRITSEAVNPLGIGAKYYVEGHREGSLQIYRESAYPFGYIGQVSFFWVKESTLWLWVHPGYKDELLHELVSLFDLSKTLNFRKEPERQNLSLEEMKLEPKKNFQPPQWTSTENDITITDLQASLNRLKLFGDETFSILQKVLFVSNLTGSSRGWVAEFFKGKEEGLKLQSLLWGKAQTAHDFPCDIILPLCVRDPRMFLPKTRTKDSGDISSVMEDDLSLDDLLQDYLKEAAFPLAETKLRERVVHEKISDNELSKKRGQLLIPGSDLVIDEENQVPVLLIRQPRSGWDLIVPAGWLMPFWIALSYKCVRAFGNRDAVHHAFEFGSIHSPEFLSPDSNCGQIEAKKDGNQAEETFFSYPPAKRENLVMLKCPFPFQVDWKLLLNHSSTTFCPTGDTEPASDLFVLRDHRILTEISGALKASKETSFLLTSVPEASRCLVGVRVKIVGKGKPTPLSMICLPLSEEEVEHSRSLVEPAQDCKNLEVKRKELRCKHQKEMAFLRKKRKKIKRRMEGGELSNSITTQAFDSTDLSQSYNTEMQSLFLPHAETVLNTVSRMPFGFLTFGGDCYINGKGGGVGYVTLLGIQKFLDTVKSWKTKDFVLIRNANKTLEYRRAQLEVFSSC